MNRFFSLFLLLCLLLSLTACGGEPQAAEPSESAPDANTEDAEAPAAPETGDTGAPETDVDNIRREAYAAFLRQVHEEWVLPDGTELDHPDMEAVEGNLFALSDVDGDGEEELILLWHNAIVAGQLEIVYGCDGTDGQLQGELRDFPGIIFYDNGAAEAPWSHNQGWAGAFWPYTLHRYDPEAGVYENMGSVDAWDKSLVSNGFPLGTDADGDGMVYTLLQDNWDFTWHSDPAGGEGYWYYEAPPVDGPEYLAWREAIVEDAEPLELAFVPLTAENIAQVMRVPYVELSDTTLPNAAG